jgi:hypothetical protein
MRQLASPRDRAQAEVLNPAYSQKSGRQDFFQKTKLSGSEAIARCERRVLRLRN